MTTPARPLVIGFSASALLGPGEAGGVSLAERLLGLNRNADQEVDLVVLAKEDPEAGIEVLASIRGHGLEVHRSAFTGDAPFGPYLPVYGVDLFVSDSEADVHEACRYGVPAGLLWEGNGKSMDGPIRVAVDADALTPTTNGSAADLENERAAALPSSAALDKLVAVLSRLGSKRDAASPLLRTALVASRGSADLERLVRSMGEQGLRFDEAYGIAGLSREEFLEAFGPHILVEARDSAASVEEKPAEETGVSTESRKKASEPSTPTDPEAAAAKDTGLNSAFQRLRMRSND